MKALTYFFDDATCTAETIEELNLLLEAKIKKTGICLLKTQLHNLATHTLSTCQQHHTSVPNVLPVVSPKKQVQKRSHDKPVRTWNLKRLADNSLYCTEFGEKIPSTPQGKIDTEQFFQEILNKKYPQLLQ